MLYIHTPESMGMSHSHSVTHTHMYKLIQMPSQMYVCTQLITRMHGKGHSNTHRTLHTYVKVHAHAVTPMHNTHTDTHLQSTYTTVTHTHRAPSMQECTHAYTDTHASKHVVLPLQYPCRKNPHKLTGIFY